MRTILLTGFEPFAGSRVNPSAEVVTRLEHEQVKGAQLHTRILPVDAELASDVVIEGIVGLKPDWCVMLGQAIGRAAISIERVAINLCDFRVPDNAGHQRIDEPIISGAPAAYFSDLPVRSLFSALREVRVPAEISLTAGSYLCNMVFYTALHARHTRWLSTRCGFIHLPMLPSQAFEQDRLQPSMGLETAYTGIRAVLEALATER